MRVTHFYHLYAGGAWRVPVSEHLSALARARVTEPLHVGLVGCPSRRRDAIDALERQGAGHQIVAQADEGFEQVTLDALLEHAKAHRDEAILYAHTKGAHCVSAWEEQWRRSMTCALYSRLEQNVAALERYDAVGCHWLTPEEFPGSFPAPIFGGNFWLARCSHLATLPVCSRESRHEAEVWIGRAARPRVLDLRPGWPGTTNCVTQIGWPR